MDARRVVALAAFAAMGIAGCSDSGGSGPVATTVTILPNGPTIRIGESVQLVASPTDANGNVISVNGQFAWSTSSAAIATVDATGNVTGVGAGTAQITASIGQLSGSTQVTVLRLPVVRVDVAPPNVTFGRSQTRQLTASTFAANDEAVTGRAVTWTSSDAAVVTVSPATGATVTITAVAPGTAAVTASSEGINRDVPVTVQPDPVIGFAPPSVSFGATAGGASPATQNVTISNTGGGTLSGLAVGTISFTGPEGWLSATLESGNTAPVPLTLRATTGSLAIGTYTASVPVSSTAPGAVTRNLPVTFTIGSAIQLGTTPTSVSFTAPGGSGNPGAQVVNVFSVNGSVIPGVAVATIQYGPSQPGGWLTATLAGSATPTTLSLSANVGTLASGTYTATVPISAPTATNSPVSVAVTLVVPAPRLELSTNAVSFIATQSVGTAGSQVITISNGGRGTLSGLAGTINFTGTGGWLTGSLSSTTAPATLTLTPVANSLARGSYSATVQVTAAAGVQGAPTSIAVTYQLVFTFDQHVAGIVSNTVAPGCANSSCHDVGGQNPNMQITGAVGHTATDVFNRVRGLVSPGNLGGSLLYQRLSGVGGPMPPSGVVPAWRDAVANWILDGARRN